MADALAPQVSADLPACRLLIGGQWTNGEKAVAVMDKFRLKPFMYAQLPSRSQISECVSAADEAFPVLQAHAARTRRYHLTVPRA